MKNLPTKEDLRIQNNNGIITIVYESAFGSIFLKRQYIDYTMNQSIKKFLSELKQLYF